jgi:uncharacterized protein YjbI with pentapeptide repeats
MEPNTTTPDLQRQQAELTNQKLQAEIQQLKSTADTELQQAALAKKKLEAEIGKLEKEGAPDDWWAKFAKIALPVGAFVTIAATLFGLWDTSNKEREERQRLRETEQQNRFEAAAKRLESSKETMPKLIAITSLGGYITPSTPSEMKRQVFSTLADIAATETDPQATASIIDFVKRLQSNALSADDWVFFLESLLSQNRALVAKGNLHTTRQFVPSLQLSSEEKEARTTAKLIETLVAKGVVPSRRDFAGIYCVECDFSLHEFPGKTDFSQAILTDAHFNGATLENANFDNAELLKTSFRNANLRHATFRVFDELSVAQVKSVFYYPHTRYIESFATSLRTEARVQMVMPDFSCARLDEADFTGHALFVAPSSAQRVVKNGDDSPWSKQILDTVRYSPVIANREIHYAAFLSTPTNFAGASLINANFEDSALFDLSQHSQVLMNTNGQGYFAVPRSLEFGEEFDMTFGEISHEIFSEEALNTGLPGGISPRNVARFRNVIRGSLFRADFAQAKFPQGMKEYLLAAPPSALEYRMAYPDGPELKCQDFAK